MRSWQPRQRSVQLQLYYFEFNLDETSSTWLGEFMKAEGADRMRSDYHGLEVGVVSAMKSCITSIIHDSPLRRP